jgi:outer membrane receptor protein involved in Fe transport
MGTLNLSLVGTLLRDLTTDTGVDPTGDTDGVFDCASYFGGNCGTPNPKWRHKLRAGFTLPNGLGISGQWRYFSKVRNDVDSDDPDLNCVTPACLAPGDRSLGAQSYFDLAVSARLADRFNFRVGVNNILDRAPPVGGGAVVGAPFGNGNTFPQVYDALGRYLFAGMTVDF